MPVQIIYTPVTATLDRRREAIAEADGKLPEYRQHVMNEVEQSCQTLDALLGEGWEIIGQHTVTVIKGVYIAFVLRLACPPPPLYPVTVE